MEGVRNKGSWVVFEIGPGAVELVFEKLDFAGEPIE
jgi:hypothetical protein